jgi:hypothetical protein
LIEHLTCNEEVAGLIPASGSKFRRGQMTNELLATRRKSLNKRIAFRQHLARLIEDNEKEIRKITETISEYKHSAAEQE